MIRCVAAGVRNVNLDFEFYGSDQESTRALYEAAKQRSPISAMFQLGEQAGQLFGAYMKSVFRSTTVRRFRDPRALAFLGLPRTG